MRFRRLMAGGHAGRALKCRKGTCSFLINRPAGRETLTRIPSNKRSFGAITNSSLFKGKAMCRVPARFVTDDFSLGAADVHRGPLGPSRKGARSRRDEHNSPDLRGPFFFSQFISSRITRLSLTSEEGEDHTRASATLCFTNEPCSLRLLAFALLPFETAATWCYNTLVVFFRRSRAPG